jgi:hypothetical protein
MEKMIDQLTALNAKIRAASWIRLSLRAFFLAAASSLAFVADCLSSALRAVAAAVCVSASP